jgi:hypothetical protein
MVIAKEWTLHSMLFSLAPSIRVDKLAATMVALVRGSDGDEGENGSGGKGRGKGKHDDEDIQGNSGGKEGVRVVENWEMNGWRG